MTSITYQPKKHSLHNLMLFENFARLMKQLNGDTFDEQLIDSSLTWQENVWLLKEQGWQVEPEPDLTYYGYNATIEEARRENEPLRHIAKQSARKFIPQLWGMLIDIAQKKGEEFNPIWARQKIENDCRDIWVLSTIRDALGDRGKDVSKQIGGRASGRVRKNEHPVMVFVAPGHLAEMNQYHKDEADVHLEIDFIKQEIIKVHTSIVYERNPDCPSQRSKVGNAHFGDRS